MSKCEYCGEMFDVQEGCMSEKCGEMYKKEEEAREYFRKKGGDKDV